MSLHPTALIVLSALFFVQASWCAGAPGGGIAEDREFLKKNSARFREDPSLHPEIWDRVLHVVAASGDRQTLLEVFAAGRDMPMGQPSAHYSSILFEILKERPNDVLEAAGQAFHKNPDCLVHWLAPHKGVIPLKELEVAMAKADTAPGTYAEKFLARARRHAKTPGKDTLAVNRCWPAKGNESPSRR